MKVGFDVIIIIMASHIYIIVVENIVDTTIRISKIVKRIVFLLIILVGVVSFPLDKPISGQGKSR